jgi:hypothetical protein
MALNAQKPAESKQNKDEGNCGKNAVRHLGSELPVHPPKIVGTSVLVSSMQ